MAGLATSQVVLLAGGLGTRLGERVKTIPKPLVEVAGKPFIQHIIEDFRRLGFKRYLILGGHLGFKLQEFASENPIADTTIDVVLEPEPLGTGGAIRHARSYLDDTFLMANADSLFGFDYLDLAKPPEEPNWLGKLALRWITQADRFGVVRLEGRKITGFSERGEGGPALINGGVYLLRREIVDSIPPGHVSLESAVFPVVAAHSRLFGEKFDGPFIDIGVPSSLAVAADILSDVRSLRRNTQSAGQ